MLFLILQLAIAQTCPQDNIKIHDQVISEQLDEISGIAVGSDGLFWVHNDSGDAPVLYGINKKGEMLFSSSIEGAQAVDWEELATHRAADGSLTLYIADLGDNKERRKDPQIYVVKEPEKLTTPLIATLPLTYADLGPRDVEAIAIDSTSNTLFVTTKGRGGTVYILSGLLKDHQLVEPLKVIHSYTIDHTAPPKGHLFVTAMDISPDGNMMAIRDYVSIQLWVKSETQQWREVLKQPPCILHPPYQPQGESLAFSADSTSLWTISEHEHQSLMELQLIFPEKQAPAPKEIPSQ